MITLLGVYAFILEAVYIDVYRYIGILKYFNNLFLKAVFLFTQFRKILLLKNNLVPSTVLYTAL